MVDVVTLAQTVNTPPSPIPTPVTFVTGPRGAGKTRWLQRELLALRAGDSAARFGVLLAEEGRTRMESFVREHPVIAVRRLFLPCFCCPALADLADTLKSLAADSGAAHLFVEVPILGAAGLLAEFDRALGWPRHLVLYRDAAWRAAENDGTLAAPYALFLSAFGGECEFVD